MRVPEIWAPKTQQSAQTAVSTVSAWSECLRCRAATRVSRPIASAGTISAARPSTVAAAIARSASLFPKVSRTVPTPTERYDQSSTGLNCRLKKMKKPRSKSFTSTRAPTSGPITHARARPARVGSVTARMTRTSPSSGIRTKEPAVSCHGRIGATSAAHTTARASTVRTAVVTGCRTEAAAGRAGASSRCRHSHQTSRPNDSASSASATDQQHAAHPQRRNPGSRDHQRDPLRRRHRLAPVAPRQRCSQPRECPARREKRVARKADQEHPAADNRGDLDAEHEDQERVDLSVQLRAERRLRPRAPCEPAVDEVERERDRSKRHQGRGRHRQLEGSRRQRGDAHRERRAGQRDPAGPAETRGGIAPESARERQVQRQAAGETDEPAGAADSHRPREHGQEEDAGQEAGQWTDLLAEVGQRLPTHP